MLFIIKLLVNLWCLRWISEADFFLSGHFCINCLQFDRTAVHYSAMNGHKEVVELLIDKYNMSATQKDSVSSCCVCSLSKV